MWPYLYPEYLGEVNSPGLDSAQDDAESQRILTKPDAWSLLPQCVRLHVVSFRLSVARQPAWQGPQALHSQAAVDRDKEGPKKRT